MCAEHLLANLKSPLVRHGRVRCPSNRHYGTFALRTARRTGRLDRAFLGGGTPLATTHPSLAAQIRRQVEAHDPYAACDDCLAVLLIAPVGEVREAAIVVAKEDGFMRRLRVCYTCKRTVELTAHE